jgi:hypothetical protein
VSGAQHRGLAQIGEALLWRGALPITFEREAATDA